MSENNNLVKLYTGGDVIINRVKQELEEAGIKSMVKDGYKQGLAAGFGDGVTSAIVFFVVYFAFLSICFFFCPYCLK